MKKETLFVAFSTWKGGMLKTAETVLAAGYLHCVKVYRVPIIDWDCPQHSIVAERKHDSEPVTGNAYFKRLTYGRFRTSGIKALSRISASTVKRIFGEAMLQRIAETQTSVDIAVLTPISMAVLKRCRIAVWKYLNKPVTKQGNKDANP